MKDIYPKLVILNTDFNNRTGGGITLKNLFEGWDKDKIVSVIDGVKMSRNNDFTVCTTYYQMGKERVVRFPLAKKYKSGLVNIDESVGIYYNDNKNGLSFRKKCVNIFFTILKKLGVFNLLYDFKVTDELKTFIIDFKPDYIYTQCGSFADRNLAIRLFNELKIPFIVHIMDDGLVNPPIQSLFGKYWNNRAFNEFETIISNSKALFSISEGMSEEYFRRYNKKFIPFHNPIDIDKWMPKTKNDFSLNLKEIRILYAGRIGPGMSYSILEFAEAINKYNKLNEEFSVTLQLLNPPINEENKLIIRKLMDLNCVNSLPFVQYDDLPITFSSTDFLLLPIDFKPEEYHYVKYSMPTKASEYMISGSPIILFCDPNVSLHGHAKKYGWAYIIEENNYEKVSKSLTELIQNRIIREQISKTAVEFAAKNFESKLVRSNFREIIEN
jgi:glycosyltransferase involved in cell wall biosynthesis